MQRRIERTLIDLERTLRDLLNPLGYRPAMLRLERDRFQNQQVQRPLRQDPSSLPFRFDRSIGELVSKRKGRRARTPNLNLEPRTLIS